MHITNCSWEAETLHVSLISQDTKISGDSNASLCLLSSVDIRQYCACVFYWNHLYVLLCDREGPERLGGIGAGVQAMSRSTSSAFDVMCCEERASHHVLIKLDGKRNLPAECKHYITRVINQGCFSKVQDPAERGK